LSVAAGVTLYLLGIHGLLPASALPSHPRALLASSAAVWFFTGSAVFLSRRGPLDLIVSSRRRDTFLFEQTTQLKREVEQRREAEIGADARSKSLLAASRMAVQCATAPRGTDPLKLIAEQIHLVTGAIATVVSAFDAERSELTVREVVIKQPLRTLINRIMGRDLGATVLHMPPGWTDVVRGRIIESADLTEITAGTIPASVAWAMKKALNIDRYTGIGLLDGDRILGTVLMGFAAGTPFLDPEVTEIFSTVATMLLREKKAEEIAQDTESRFKDMIDQLPQPVIELDLAGAIMFANEMARDVLDIGGAGIHRVLRAADLVIPEDRHAAMAEFAAVRAGRRQRRTEFTMIHRNGSRFTAVISARPIMKQGRVCGVRGVIADISSIRRAEERVRDSQQMLQLVLDLIPQSIFWKDSRSVYLGCNRIFALRAGLSNPEEVIGKTDDDFPWAAQAEDMRSIDRQVLDAGEAKTNYHQTMTTALGKNRQARLSKRPLRNAQGEVLGIMGVSEDITEWVSNEAERVLLGTAIEKAAESVVITNDAGEIQYVNPVFLKNYGYTREEVLGKNPRILKSGRHEESYYRDLWATIGSGRVWHGKLFNLRKDRTLLTEEAIISPVLDPNGIATHYVKVARDVTYEVDLEQRYQQAQKMEAVGRLAGGVAHDFNNILTIISGYSEILVRGLGKDGAWREELGAITDAAARASTLTGQLLTFSRKQKLEPQVIELNAVVRGIEPMLRRLIGEDIVLTVDLEPSLGTVLTVFVDKGQVEQVVLNLAINARDAMPKGGRLRLRTWYHRFDQAHLEAHPGAEPGGYAVMEMADTGMGMTEEVKAHLFEPFFTTKPEHKGTGLGLATVYGIVAQSRGFIEVESRLGEGSAFQIFFPLTEEAEAVRPKIRPAAFSLEGNESILFVEDDPAIRRLLQRSLRESGFTVTEASNAVEAVEIFRARPGTFQLLLTDVVLPESSGPELADILRREQPGIKVLFISGYTANETVEYGVLGSEFNLLQKPFSMQELARRVRETLDRG
jgi:two-component system cell cycle sensor histidine kinase/response regulator CckA